MKFLYTSFLFAVLFILTACSIKPETTEITTYSLNSNRENIKIDKDEFCADKLLRISSLKGSAGINNTRIYYSKPNNEFQPYLKSYWVEAPSISLMRLIYLDIVSNNIFSSVTQNIGLFREDYVLNNEIFSYEQKFDENGNSFSEIGAIFAIVDVKNKTTISTKEFVIKKNTPTNDAKGAVFAFNEAANELSKEVSVWLKSLMCK